MAYTFNPFTSTLDYYEASNFKGVLAVAPSSPENGWWYVNSTNDTIYLYYVGAWQVLHVLIGITYVTPSVGMPVGLMAITYGFDA